jgi:hypothetical protein
MADSTLAPPSGNLDAFNLKSVETGGLINEDVMQKIFDISKIPLPFTDMVGSTRHKNERFDWVVDELNKPDLANAVADGQDAGNPEEISGGRVGNHSQISDKVLAVSYRADASDTIGRAKELAYRLTRANQEIRRDVEAIALWNQASDAGAGSGTDDHLIANAISAPTKTGTLATWIETSVRNADGSDATASAGGYNYSTGLTEEATMGVGAALSFQGIKDCQMDVYMEGGDPSVFMSTPAVISKLSTYLFDNEARVANLVSDQGAPANSKATALSSVNVIVGDFGTLKLVPNRLMPDAVGDGTGSHYAFLLDPEYVSLSYLEGYRTDTLAKTGLAEKRQISVDWGLRVHTEKAHGMIINIDPNADAVA